MCLYSTELILVAAALFFFFWSLREKLEIATLGKLAPWWGLAVFVSAIASLGLNGLLFAGAYKLDSFSQFAKILMSAGYAMTLVASVGIQDIEERHRPEFYLFLTTATLGMFIMVGATDLITLYMALELSSYSLYLLIPLRRNDEVSLEAGIKYLLQGVAASGVMVYGLSLLFGLTQTTHLYDMAGRLPQLAHVPALWVACFLALVPVMFKLSLVPFHFWAPDVYKGGNTQTVGFISTVSKVAALSVFIRFVMITGSHVALLNHVWVGLAIASMTLGNLAALNQQDIKRLMGYSSVAQAGYLLIGVVCQSSRGLSAAMFYAAVYVVMTLAVFFVMTRISETGENLSLRQFRGLYARSPLLAFTLMLSLFSLAGVPPLAGFTGKWLIFSTAVYSGYKVLAIAGILNSVVSLYYYLLIVKEAYSPEAGETKPILRTDAMTAIVCVATIACLLLVGFCPGILMPLAERSVALFF